VAFSKDRYGKSARGVKGVSWHEYVSLLEWWIVAMMRSPDEGVYVGEEEAGWRLRVVLRVEEVDVNEAEVRAWMVEEDVRRRPGEMCSLGIDLEMLVR